MDRTQDLITCLWTFYLIIHLNHVKRRVLTLEQERFDLRSWKGLKLVSRTQMPYCRSRNALLVEGMHQYSISCFSVLPLESYIRRIFFLKLALFRRRKEQNISFLKLHYYLPQHVILGIDSIIRQYVINAYEINADSFIQFPPIDKKIFHFTST